MRPVGVTTRKNTIPITIGAIKEPIKIPNLNHSKFNGFNNFEFIKPKIRKGIDKTIKYILKSPLFFSGHNPIIIRTKKKTNPKLLFELILIFDFGFIFFNSTIYRK